MLLLQKFPKTPLHLPSPPSHPTNIPKYPSPGTERNIRPLATSNLVSSLNRSPLPHSSISFNAQNSSFKPSPHLTLTSPHLTLTLFPLLLQTPLTLLFSLLLSSPPSLPHPNHIPTLFSTTTQAPHHRLNRPIPHSAGATPGQ
jgi:hypothetical protein